MKTTLRKVVTRYVKSLAGNAGYKIVPRQKDFESYLNFRETLKLATQAGVAVGDFIEVRSKVPHTSQQTLDNMAELGVFGAKVDRVCEIGPGSGRYLAKTIQCCNPQYYEIYETASDWAQWLVQEYRVVSQSADGVSLKMTPSSSIDLVQAHKVFPGLSFFSAVRYFEEMARVTREGGKVVLDILDEDCMDDQTVARWLAPEVAIDKWDFTASMIPRKYAIDFFVKRGFALRGSFFIDLWPGKTEYLVFSK
jgi:SAM-dependent methyltransferase